MAVLPTSPERTGLKARLRRRRPLKRPADGLALRGSLISKMCRRGCLHHNGESPEVVVCPSLPGTSGYGGKTASMLPHSTGRCLRLSL